MIKNKGEKIRNKKKIFKIKKEVIFSIIKGNGRIKKIIILHSFKFIKGFVSNI